MIHVDNEYILIRWDKDVRCVHLEWKCYAEGVHFREALDSGLVLLSRWRGSRWLVDLRLAYHARNEDQEWVAKDWYPRSMVAGIRRAALVVPQRALADALAKRIRQRCPEREQETFATVEAAKAWLSR